MLQLPLARHGRRVASLGLAGAATVLLSGCYGITGQTAAQHHVVGHDVTVDTALCITGGQPSLPPIWFGTESTPGDPKDDDGCTTGSAEHAHPLQLFVSYAVPLGTKVPDTITASGSLSGVTFAKSPEYTTAVAAGTISGSPIEALSVSGRDEDAEPVETEIVSYGSSVIPKQLPITAAVQASLSADFDVSGVTGDFDYATSTGWRWIDEDFKGLGGDRPIVCTSSSSDTEDTPGTSCRYSTNFASLKLNTIAISAPGADYPSASAVTAGETAVLAFPTTSHRGGDAPASATLSASSTLPDAPISAPSEYALGTNDPIQVTVQVPANTPSGDYTVQVDAGDDAPGHMAVAKLRVNAAAALVAAPKTPAAPATELTVPQKLAGATAAMSKALSNPVSGKALRQGKAKATIALPARGTVRVSLLGKAKGTNKAPVIAVGTATSERSGLVDLLLKRTAEGKRYLHGKKTVTGTLVVKYTGREGKFTTSSPITLTLP